MAFVCNMRVCVCLNGRRQRGDATGGQTQQVQDREEKNRRKEEEVLWARRRRVAPASECWHSDHTR